MNPHQLLNLLDDFAVGLFAHLIIVGSLFSLISLVLCQHILRLGFRFDQQLLIADLEAIQQSGKVIFNAENPFRAGNSEETSFS